MSERAPLRERNRARTRSEIREAARRAFHKQGYENTTLDQIAEAAVVSVRTLLRHFESKEQLALASMNDALESFRQTVTNPDRQIDTLHCWRQHVEYFSSQPGDEKKELFAFVYGNPALRGGRASINDQLEDLMAQELAKDARQEIRLEHRLQAAFVVACNSSVTRRWLHEGGTGDLTTQCLAVVDYAIANFSAGRKLRGVT